MKVHARGGGRLKDLALLSLFEGSMIVVIDVRILRIMPSISRLVWCIQVENPVFVENLRFSIHHQTFSACSLWRVRECVSRAAQFEMDD